MSQTNKSKLMLISSMLIFGTIGIFRKYIGLPSGIIAMSRGLVGMISIIIYMLITKKQICKKAIKSSMIWLILSGVALGFNWILLFEAYNYTTVATATLCYYMAPVFVMIVSPFLLKEKLKPVQIICILIAIAGMVFASGVLQTGFSSMTELRGIFLGLGAAVLYATVVMMNKKLTDIPAVDKTLVQLGISAIVLLPYNLFTTEISTLNFSLKHIGLLLLVGILHTGISYVLYFGSIKHLSVNTVALYSYIDPIAAIVCSAVILSEKIGFYSIIGAVLVLGATALSEIYTKV